MQPLGHRLVVASQILLRRRLSGVKVSNPTKMLRSAASAARSMRSRKMESTVAAPWNTRFMPRIPANRAPASAGRLVAVAALSPWEAMTRIAAAMIAFRRSSLLGLAMLVPELHDRYVKPPLAEGRGFSINEDRGSRFRDGRC